MIFIFLHLMQIFVQPQQGIPADQFNAVTLRDRRVVSLIQQLVQALHIVAQILKPFLHGQAKCFARNALLPGKPDEIFHRPLLAQADPLMVILEDYHDLGFGKQGAHRLIQPFDPMRLVDYGHIHTGGDILQVDDWDVGRPLYHLGERTASGHRKYAL